jgi:septal ring factor EnvC (AmiA/AmiB activator)
MLVQQIFTPSELSVPRACQASKDSIEQARKNEIAERKATAAALRAQKATEVASRCQQRADAALQKVAARQVANEERARKATKRRLERMYSMYSKHKASCKEPS